MSPFAPQHHLLYSWVSRPKTETMARHDPLISGQFRVSHKPIYAAPLPPPTQRRLRVRKYGLAHASDAHVALGMRSGAQTADKARPKAASSTLSTSVTLASP